MSDVYIREDMAVQLAQQPLLQWAIDTADAAASKDIYRSREGRKTLRFALGEKAFFLKLHRGIGWGEILKNLLQFRLPVTSARNEYVAVRRLERIGVPTLSIAAYGSWGRNPATRDSLLVTDELTHTVSLEDYCADWAASPPPPALRQKLVAMLAQTSRSMHAAGINHRDYYLCHFHLDLESLATTPRAHVIDLHRAQCRDVVPKRWLIKDLAGLYFSAMDCGLTLRDVLRFLKHYEVSGLHTAFGERSGFWMTVSAKAQQLYRREHGREPPLPRVLLEAGSSES